MAEVAPRQNHISDTHSGHTVLYEEALSCVFSELNTGCGERNAPTCAVACETCAHIINEGQNWCVECGTAVTRRQESMSHLQASCSNVKNSSIMAARSRIKTDLLRIRPQTRFHFSSVKKTAPTLHKQPMTRCKLSPGRESQKRHMGRHWDTSSVYLWRKPSSIRSLDYSSTKHKTDIHSNVSPKTFGESLPEPLVAKYLRFKICLQNCLMFTAADWKRTVSVMATSGDNPPYSIPSQTV